MVLEGDQKEQKKAEQLIRSLGRNDMYDLGEIVCDAIENIAQTLIREGCVAYEILSDNDMFNFSSRGLWRIPKHYLRVIPYSDWDKYKKKFILILLKKSGILNYRQHLEGVEVIYALLKC